MCSFQFIVFVKLREMAGRECGDIVRFQVCRCRGQSASYNLLHLTRVQVYARSEFRHDVGIEEEFLDGERELGGKQSVTAFFCREYFHRLRIPVFFTTSKLSRTISQHGFDVRKKKAASAENCEY